MKIEIFTDGACRGNPGPGGWGALIRCEQQQRTLLGSAKETTNNRMELTAVIEALRSIDQAAEIHITTDSKYVQQGISSWIHNWKRRQWRTASNKPVKNIDLWQILDALTAPSNITWHWVKGHSGHAENEIADALANQAIDELLAEDSTR